MAEAAEKTPYPDYILALSKDELSSENNDFQLNADAEKARGENPGRKPGELNKTVIFFESSVIHLLKSTALCK